MGKKAGDAGNPPVEGRTVAVFAIARIGQGEGRMGSDPPGWVTAIRVKDSRGVGVAASRQHEKAGEKREYEQLIRSYPWHRLHPLLFWRPWHLKQEAGLIFPSIWCCEM